MVAVVAAVVGEVVADEVRGAVVVVDVERAAPGRLPEVKHFVWEGGGPMSVYWLLQSLSMKRSLAKIVCACCCA